MNGLPVARPMAIASLLAVSCGCTTNLKQPKQLHDQGRFEAAAAAVQRVEAEPQDTIWVRLEQGKILQDAGRLEESNRNFEGPTRFGSRSTIPPRSARRAPSTTP